MTINFTSEDVGFLTSLIYVKKTLTITEVKIDSGYHIISSRKTGRKNNAVIKVSSTWQIK